MFYVFNIKKFRLSIIAALLFCILTAIIMKRVEGLENTPEECAAYSASGPVLVIDAGHGGLDGGAVSAGGMLESTVNLAIAKKLQILCELFGVPAVMTRTEAELNYPPEAETVSQKKQWDQKNRVNIINTTENAVLISIHQNKFPDPRPRGSQVLYGTVDGSQKLGEEMHALLNETLNPENRRVAAPIQESIYLMRSVKCPAVLVECGFLSNVEEAGRLAQEPYQTKLAMVMLTSFLRYTKTSETA